MTESYALPDIIARVRSGVVRIALFNGSDQVGSGSGFLTRGKLVSNSHVIRGEGDFDAVEITFGDEDVSSKEPIRLAREDFYRCFQNESPEGGFDYAVLDISEEPEISGRFEFELIESDGVAQVGDQVLFFGFPFGGKVLTAHVGYISADYRENSVHLLQIDGSINRGNSGGPLFHIGSGKVIGIVTLTQTGLERDFDLLVKAIADNEQVLSQMPGGIRIGGVNPAEAARITMTLLRHVTANMKRSANVGIGWAYCAEHILKEGL